MSWEPRPSWDAWLKEGRVKAHAQDRVEIAAHLRAADRAMRDAALPAMSPEGRFQLAYSAALDLATAAVLASGHQIKSRLGHHELTFEAAGLALGAEMLESLQYFDLCRRRRNVIIYDGDAVSASQSDELLSESRRFKQQIAAWLKQRHPNLA